MPLKTSSFNKTLFRKNLTRFWPIWGMATAGGALVPLVLLVQLLRYGVKNTFGQGTVEFSAMYYEAVQYGLPIISLIYAILIAVAVWSYLYNHRSVTMMHTLPMRREGLFLTSFLSGMAMLLIPYVVTGGGMVLISLFCGLFDPKALLLTVAAVIGESFFFFASATLCAFVVSNVFALPAVYFLLHFLAVLMDWLVGTFSQGFLFGLGRGYSGAVDYLSPTVYLMEHVQVDRTYTEVTRWSEIRFEYFYDNVLTAVALENAWLIAVYACVGVILLGFAWMLYKIHRSESAGDVVAVEWLRPVFRYGLAVLAAMGGGLCLYALFWNSFQSSQYYDMLPLLAFMMFAGLVGYFAAAMLLEKSFRVFKGNWKGSLVLLGFCVVLCTALHFDVFRVTQRVPAIDDVQWVEIYVSNNSYMFYPGEEDHLLEEVRGLHRSIVEDMDYGRATEKDIWYNYGEYKDDYARENVNFTYKLKNGQEVYRSYRLAVNRDRMQQPGTFDYAMDQLVNSAEMRRKRLHAGDDRYTIDGGSLYLEKRSEGFDFSSREAAEVLAALSMDAAEGTWGTYDWFINTRAFDYAVSMDLQFKYHKEDNRNTYSDWLSIRLRPEMTHTIACLKRIGYLTEGDLVTYAELYPEDYKETVEYYYEKYGMPYAEAASIGIIGGADGPTAITVAVK